MREITQKTIEVPLTPNQRTSRLRVHKNTLKQLNSLHYDRDSINDDRFDLRESDQFKISEMAQAGWLGWIRLGYGKMTEEFRVPSDHLESLHFCGHHY